MTTLAVVIAVLVPHALPPWAGEAWGSSSPACAGDRGPASAGNGRGEQSIDWPITRGHSRPIGRPQGDVGGSGHDPSPLFSCSSAAPPTGPAPRSLRPQARRCRRYAGVPSPGRCPGPAGDAAAGASWAWTPSGAGG